MPPKKSGTARRVKNDAYYTTNDVVIHAVEKAKEMEFLAAEDVFVDTSAGDNRLSRALKSAFGIDCIAFDIDPKDNGVTKCDWLQTTRDMLQIEYDRQVCIGFNPPFGLSSGMIRKFLEHAFTVANVTKIMLIHPTIDLKRVTPSTFNVVHTETLPKNSFEIVGGKKYNTNASLSFFAKNIDCPTTTKPFFILRTKADKAHLHWIKYSRYEPINDDHNMIIRRTGVNFLRQIYIIKKKTPQYYIENGIVSACKNFNHLVTSDAFFKCLITNNKVDLIKTAEKITTCRRDQDDLLKTPPSTTHEHTNRILKECVVMNQDN